MLQNTALKIAIFEFASDNNYRDQDTKETSSRCLCMGGILQQVGGYVCVGKSNEITGLAFICKCPIYERRENKYKSEFFYCKEEST